MKDHAKDTRPPGFATKAIHHGYDPVAFEGAVSPPSS